MRRIEKVSDQVSYSPPSKDLNPIFLVCLASSPGSTGFPVEIGWAFGDGRWESHLIHPMPEWLSQPQSWDAESERAQGITLNFLHLQGELAENIALRMNTELAGRTLFTENPQGATRWLRMLFEPARVDPAFIIAPESSVTMITELARHQGLSRKDPSTGRSAADHAAQAEQAGSNALHWVQLWRLMTRDSHGATNS